MNRTCYTHNQYHFGDNLVFLHLLRSIARRNPKVQFVHFAHEHLLGQLREVTEDISNIILLNFESDQWAKMKRKSINTWKNARDFWDGHKLQYDWSAFMLAHHKWTAERMGFRSEFVHVDQLLFDYPAIKPCEKIEPWFSEFLVVNSDPQSGQLKPMIRQKSGYLDKLIWQLGQKHSVFTTKPANGALCTQAMGHSLSMIGHVSIRCKHHIMVATGPMWTTFNTHNNHHWSHARRRIVILDNGEKINMPHIKQVSSVEEVFDIAKQEGWL